MWGEGVIRWFPTWDPGAPPVDRVHDPSSLLPTLIPVAIVMLIVIASVIIPVRKDRRDRRR
jgi:hypothetical protein